MLNVIFTISIMGLGLFASFSVMHFIATPENKKQFYFREITFIILFLTVITSGLVLDSFDSKAQKNVEIEMTEIAEIYSQDIKNTYIITTKDNNVYTIKTDEVYKGDSNYIIKKRHTNVTDKFKFWADIDEYTYSIVVTDTNIQTLPNLTK